VTTFKVDFTSGRGFQTRLGTRVGDVVATDPRAGKTLSPNA
jgi:hypothetical protein